MELSYYQMWSTINNWHCSWVQVQVQVQPLDKKNYKFYIPLSLSLTKIFETINYSRKSPRYFLLINISLVKFCELCVCFCIREIEEKEHSIREMKRSRDTEKKSEINSAIEELSVLVIVKPGKNHETAHIPTKPFLSLCYMILQVLGWYYLSFFFFFLIFKHENYVTKTNCNYVLLFLLQIR